MELTQLEDTFVDIGGVFLTSAFDLRERMEKMKAIVFVWDGVFNGGHKDITGASNYSVVDTGGVDLLRFGFFLAYKSMIKVAVMSDTDNSLCLQLGKKDHYDNVYLNGQNKESALRHFCNEHDIHPDEIIYVYDEVADLKVAEQMGIRLAIGRLSSPIFVEYMERHKLADYISTCQGNEHAVREMCELLLTLLDQHFNVIDHKGKNEENYRDYLSRKALIETATNKTAGIVKLESRV
ncbi:hypothetical protein [Owenweeksia hongkongensis]|uniref:hypothetical protein n=1 Tax=Owenweeksia hongkongensis TaxID=253245 RepID=UPI003A91E5B0